jgi:hypothetical protein
MFYLRVASNYGVSVTNKRVFFLRIVRVLQERNTSQDRLIDEQFLRGAVGGNRELCEMNYIQPDYTQSRSGFPSLCPM